MITPEYFVALMFGVGVGTTVYVLAYLLGSGLFALIERPARRKARERDARIRAEVEAAALARLDEFNAQADADYAVRLADLDARRERLATPEDRATV